MAGRPPLRIGQHGKITRIQLDKCVWIARCRYRDTDGVTRVVERKSPVPDQHGKKAEDALLSALETRQPPGGGDISKSTKVTDLIKLHIERLTEDGKADRTIDTYKYTAGKLGKLIGGLRVEDATPPRIDAALRSMKTAHGPSMAKQAKFLFLGGLQLAVMAGVISSNPTRDVISSGTPEKPKGAKPVATEELGDLLEKVQMSDFCIEKDLVDPIHMLMATGLRRSELLGLRWVDYDPVGGNVTVTGKLIRVHGQGLKRVSKTKTDAGRRTIGVPPSVQEMLAARKRKPYYGEQPMIFPSTAGTWRDPDNFNKDWRRARESLGVPDVSSHSFRKSVATLIDEGGLSARIGADHLGHARISMTQDTYMRRGQTHPEVVDLVEKALRKRDE